MSTLNVNTINAATSGQAVAVDISNPKSFRNLHVNGGMLVHQRGGSITSDGYSLDMFARQTNGTGGAYTITQSTTAPVGFSKSLKVDVTTADTTITGNEYIQIKSKIEAQDLQQLAYGTASAKNMVLSFYVRSNKTGNYSVNIKQGDSSFRQVTLQYTINSADTWERKSFSIAGDQSGNINDDTGDGFIICWGLCAGPDKKSGSLRSAWHAQVDADQHVGMGVNILDSTSNEWYLTGVQLEVGSYATDFEHRSYSDELARSKRYFQRYPEIGSDGYSAYPGNAAACMSSTGAGWAVKLDTMRAAPTVTEDGSHRIVIQNTGHSVTSFSTPHMSASTAWIVLTCSGGGMGEGKAGIVGRNNDTSGYWNFSAEL